MSRRLALSLILPLALILPACTPNDAPTASGSSGGRSGPDSGAQTPLRPISPPAAAPVAFAPPPVPPPAAVNHAPQVNPLNPGFPSAPTRRAGSESARYLAELRDFEARRQATDAPDYQRSVEIARQWRPGNMTAIRSDDAPGRESPPASDSVGDMTAVMRRSVVRYEQAVATFDAYPAPASCASLKSAYSELLRYLLASLREFEESHHAILAVIARGGDGTLGARLDRFCKALEANDAAIPRLVARANDEIQRLRQREPGAASVFFTVGP